MKSPLPGSPTLTALCAAAFLAVGAAAPAPADDPAIESLIAAERGFAKSSVESGMKPAFAAHLAENGIVFRPGPLNGLRVWQSRPLTDAVLEWAPAYAEVSGAGDLGFTFGPWAYSAHRDAQPSAFGTFVTVWRRQRDGGWKVELDVGASHPGQRPDLDAPVTRGPFHPRPDSTQWRKWDAGVGVSSGNVGVGVGTGGFGVGFHSGGGGFGFGSGGVRSRQDYEWQRTRHEKNELMNAERRLPFEAKNHDWDRALRAVAAGDLRTLREGSPIELGVDAAIERSTPLPKTRDFQSRGNGVAASWDLGYAYGLVVTPAKKGARPDTAAYVHLWRKDDAGAWKMMLDVEAPFPKP